MQEKDTSQAQASVDSFEAAYPLGGWLLAYVIFYGGQAFFGALLLLSRPGYLWCILLPITVGTFLILSKRRSGIVFNGLLHALQAGLPIVYLTYSALFEGFSEASSSFGAFMVFAALSGFIPLLFLILEIVWAVYFFRSKRVRKTLTR